MCLTISRLTLQANDCIEYIEVPRSLCGFELHGEISMTVVLKLLIVTSRQSVEIDPDTRLFTIRS